MRILVTGGSGFIGTNLVEHFVNQEHNVINLDIASPSYPKHGVYWKKVDVLNMSALVGAIQAFQPEIILHMAARTDLDGKSQSAYSANIDGVRNLIKAIGNLSSLRRIVFASSRLVCRIGYQPTSEHDYCPTTFYGQSKMIGEQIVRASSGSIPCPWIILRPTSIWGPWFNIPYKTFFLSIAKNRYFHPGNMQILKSFGFVGNTVYELQRILEVSEDLIHAKTIYLADYPPINVTNMANSIQREMDSLPIRTLDIRLLRSIALMGDIMKAIGWRNPPLTRFRLNNLITPMVHDLDPLKSIAGELPYNMEEGIRMTVSWMKSYGDLK